MRILGLPLCVLCILCGFAATGDAEPSLPARDAIDAAIENGVTWLLDEQKPVGTWGSGKAAVGKTALAVYALLHCGLAEDQDTKQARRLGRALAWLDKHGAGRAKRRERDTRTYEASLLLMLLRARGRDEDRPRMQRLADVLASTQIDNGQWWYDGEGARRRSGGDNSNTQFAMLALGVAVGEGLDVPKRVLAKADRWWSTSAGARGGFGYASGGSPKSAATGSMTAAGIASLAITDAAGAMHDPVRSRATRARALAFLAEVFSVTRNHGPTIDRKQQRQRKAGRGWLHYYLWTVERAMVLAGQTKLGDLDWYAAGARHLIGTQKDDGSWRGEHPLYATCFALLFLTRAADRPRAFTPPSRPVAEGPGPTVTPGPTEPPKPAPERRPLPPGPGPLGPGWVDDWLQEALPLGELARRCRLAGPTTLLPLVRALQHPDKDVRRRAFEALRALLPDERTERVDRHPLPRGRLALWLRTNARHLKLVDGRFQDP